MAIAFESFSSGFDTGTVSLAKPTGLAEGDLMVAFVVWNGEDSPQINAPSGFSVERTIGTAWLDSGIFTAFTKVATSSDVSASTFDFQTGDPVQTVQAIGGILYRISDAAADNIQSNVVDGENSDTVSITPPSSRSLLIIAGGAIDNGSDNLSWDSYDSTGSPTYTERADISTDTGGAADVAAADAIYESETEITSYSANTTGLTTEKALMFVFIPEPEDASVTGATGTISLVGNTGSPSGSANVNGATGTLTIEGNPGTAEEEQKDWTAQSKSSASWTPKPKS